MADYNSALPIRSENDNLNSDERVVTQINGGVTPANKAEVNSSNEVLVKDADTEQAVADVETKLGDKTQYTQITDGVEEVAVNSDGSINVNVVDTAVGDQIHIYGTAPTIAPATPTTVVDYTVTGGKTFLLKEIYGTASGKIKVELKAGTPSSETTRAVGFNSTGDPNVPIIFSAPIEVVAGDKILVIITNRDNSSSDLYAFINGVEV